MNDDRLVTCGRCARRTSDGLTCEVFKTPIKHGSDSCPLGISKLYTCDMCGKQFPLEELFIDNDGPVLRMFCKQCNNMYYTCYNCGHSTKCAFETSSSTLPKQVQKQMKTPQGYIVTTIRNPERVRETCEKGCECFDKENGCLRQTNYCKNFKSKA